MPLLVWSAPIAREIAFHSQSEQSCGHGPRQEDFGEVFARILPACVTDAFMEIARELLGTIVGVGDLCRYVCRWEKLHIPSCTCCQRPYYVWRGLRSLPRSIVGCGTKTYNGQFGPPLDLQRFLS